MNDNQHFNREIERAVDQLILGNIVICPTDTDWALTCDATNTDAVKKLLKMRPQEEGEPVLVLLDHADKLTNYIHNLPEGHTAKLEEQQEPVTVLYHSSINLAQPITEEQKPVAIRIVRDEFMHKVVQRLDRPVLAVPSSKEGKRTSKFSEVSQELQQKADYVVNLPDHQLSGKEPKQQEMGEDGSLK